jgi:hypothetical protein
MKRTSFPQALLCSIFALFTAILAVACSADFGAYPEPALLTPLAPCHVKRNGDSITRQAGGDLKEFLPNCVIDNLGVDGAMARDIGTPVFESGVTYSFSYGTNECLGAVSPEDYRLTLNHILHTGKGHRIVLEAPWRVVDPRCNPRIEEYRQTVIDLGKAYNIPVVELDMNQDHIGEGIHLPPSHMRERARLLAAVILKL